MYENARKKPTGHFVRRIAIAIRIFGKKISGFGLLHKYEQLKLLEGDKKVIWSVARTAAVKI